MKYIILISSFILFSSCSNEREGNSLAIEILNTEMYSVKNFDAKNKMNFIRFDNYEHDSLIVNKIEIKISNPGSRSQAFFIPKKIEKIKGFGGGLQLSVFSNQEIFPSLMPWLVNRTMHDPTMAEWMINSKQDSINYNFFHEYSKENINMEEIQFQRIMEFVLLSPGESKFFTFYKTLPIFEESLAFYLYEFDETVDYQVQISLKNDKQTLKNISSNQLKDIKSNNSELFNGTIKSNRVPIKFRAIKKDTAANRR